MVRAESKQSSWGVWLLVLAVLAWVFWMLAGSEGESESGQAETPGDASAETGEGFGRPKVGDNRPEAALRPSARISGTVTTKGGGPLVGATICARGSSPDLGSAQLREPRCATSTANGRYAIEGVLPAQYLVVASARQHIPASHDVEGSDDDRIQVSPGQSVQGVDIALRPGGVEVRGQVVDLTGGEIEGAIVTVSSNDGPGYPLMGMGVGAVTKSDAEGKFVAWAAKGTATAQAQANGYAPGQAKGRAPGSFLTVRLTPESVLAGRVVHAESGSPVAGASVSATGSGAWEGGTTAITGDDGSFRIDRLEPGRYKPTATTERGFGEAQESVLLGLGEQSEPVLIQLRPAALVTARIAVDDGDEGCPGGGASLADPTQDEQKWAEVQVEGSVEFRGVLPGRYQVNVYCDGYVSEPKYEPVTVAKQDVTGLVWRVSSGLAIRGVVVGPKGDPSGGVIVQVTHQASQSGGALDESWGASKEDGTFEFKGLTAGEYSVRAQDSANYPAQDQPAEVTLADSDVDGVKIVLPAGGTVRGRVVDEGGEPVKAATVTLRGESWSSAPVGDDGSFELGGLQPGRYRAHAQTGIGAGTMRAPGATDDDVAGESVDVRAGEVAEVELVVASRNGSIEGMVVDEGGGPITDAFVQATRESDSAAAAAGSATRQSRWSSSGDPTFTDTDGRFEVDGLEDGLYTVRAYRKGGGEAVEEHVKVGSDVTLAIRPTGRISGAVTVPKGAPPIRFQVVAQDPKTGAGRSETFFYTGGSWSIGDLPAGTFHVTATADQGTGERRGIALAGGQTVDGITIPLQGRGSVHGVIVDAETGAPVADMLVVVPSPDGGIAISGAMFEGGDHITKADGRYIVKDVPAGRVSLQAVSREFDADYDSGQLLVTAVANKDVQAPPMKLFRRRMGAEEDPGDLGFKLKDPEPGSDPERQKLLVAFVRPGGPAQVAGLVVGDEFASVDGHPVSAAERPQFWALVTVPPGTRLAFGLVDGRELTLVAGPPP